MGRKKVYPSEGSQRKKIYLEPAQVTVLAGPHLDVASPPNEGIPFPNELLCAERGFQRNSELTFHRPGIAASVREVWYQLVTADGERYTGSTVGVVTVTLGTPVVKFIDRIYEKEKPILQRFALSTLNVFLDRDSLRRSVSLPNSTNLDWQGSNAEAPLLVMVPSNETGIDPQSLAAPTPRSERAVETSISNLAARFVLEENIPRLNIPGLHGFITLPRRFLAGSGIEGKDDDTHLYIRKSFLGQLDFIRNRVITGGKCGYIFGMPGSGKSVGTYLVGSSVAADWNVIWIHFQFSAFNIDNRCLCVRMSGCSKYVAEVPFETMHEFLRTRQNFFDEREILILDSITNRTEFDKFIPNSADWWRGDQTNRRLILVSSMALFEKFKDDDLESAGIELYEQFSWSLAEYKKAIKNSGFFNSVEKFLDADPRRNQKRDKILEAKFFYSGGCARSTFQKTTEQVKRLIKKSIDSISGISSLFSTVTSQNLLDVDFDGGQRLVSAYAALQIALIKGPYFIMKLAIHPLLLGNPFIHGGFFELLFFSYAQQGEIVLHDKNGDDVEWMCKGEVFVFIPNSPTLLTCAQGQWLKPNIVNQGSYDGIYLHKRMRRNVIKFMLITREHKRGVQLQYFLELVHELKREKVFTAQEVEIYFIVPRKNLATYKIGRIQSPDTLKTLGWPDFEDGVRDRIQILGLDF